MRWQDVQGWFSEADAGLYRFVLDGAFHASHFVEVGSWKGRSAAAMAEAIRDSGKLVRFDCVDTWQGTRGTIHDDLLPGIDGGLRAALERNLRACGLWRYVNPITGPSTRVADGYEDGSLDFVYLDGDHSRAEVEADLRAWIPKLVPGGKIGGHDWTNENVRGAVAAVLRGAPVHYSGSSWCVTVGPRTDVRAVSPRRPLDVTLPPSFPAGAPWYDYLRRGFGESAQTSPELLEHGYWLPAGSVAKPGQPIHVAALEIGRRRVWYDFSDFPSGRLVPGDGNPYFKVMAQRGDGTLPIGQTVSAVGEYEGLLDRLRDLAELPAEHAVCAMFATTDGRNNEALREPLVRMLRDREHDGAGIWRFNSLRSEPDPELVVAKMPRATHWLRQAASRLCFALPGVCGDWTWRHTEVLGIGRPLVTLRTGGDADYDLPGNWRGCWIEMERDLSDLDLVLAVDDEEAGRVARLGRWYYERNLEPEAMAWRMILKSV